MAGERTLKVTILGDAKRLQGAFGDAGKAADGFGSKLTSAAKVAGVALAGMGVAGVAFGKQAVGAASDLAEVEAKTKVIFGNAAKDIEKFASSAARDFGQTKTQAMNAASTFATFGKAAGLQNKDLSDFATNLTGLASDLASFNNTKPEEAVEALGAALRGESEPLRRYGVMLDDATLKAAAMELGIYNGTGALTAQQKTLAAQKVIMDQTKDAQGDFARTSDGLANQQRILSATMGDLSAKIGTALLPAMTGITSTVGEIVTAFSEGGWRGAMDKVAEIWGELWPKIKAKLGEFLTGLGNFIVAEGPGILRKLGEWTGQFLEWVGSMIPPLLSKLGELLGKMLQWVSDNREAILNKLGEWTGKFLEWAGSVIVPLLAKFGELLGKVFEWVSNNRQAIFDKLGEWTGKFIDWAGDMLVKLLQFLAEKVIPAVLKWIVDNGPTILLELGKWTLSFLAWAAEMNLKLLGKLAEAALALLGWIADTALEVAKELPKWTAEFVAWVVGLPGAMAGEMAKLITWIGNQAANLPGQLAHWTTQFLSWLAGLPTQAAQAIADLAAAIGSAVFNAVKDGIASALNPFSGGPNAAASASTNGVLNNYGGVKVPNGSAPTNSQGSPGQTFAQMAASGMTVAEIAEKTGLDPAVIQANLTVANAGAFIGSVLGGDHDDENDGDLSPSGPGEQNLTANAVKLRRQIQASFKGYSSIGGYAYRTTAAGTPSDHATGKALDVMMPRHHDPLGDTIAAWAVGQGETKYVIWDNQIWSRQNPRWRDYATSGKVGAANQGSATGRHEDHVHISVLGKGGIVRARQGGTLALLGEAGQDEAVVPLPRGGGSAGVGTTVVVHVHGNVIRERDLVLSIRDGLLDLQRQGVSLGFN